MTDSKVTDLASATTPLSGTEVVYLVQGGLDTQATAQDIANLGGGGGAVASVNGQVGVVVLDATDIGLGNVNNTSDANKPVSTAQQTALNGKVNLLGTAGGQTINGGTAAGESLTLSSTTNATKGKVLFGTSAYDEVNNRLGINTNAPATQLEVFGTDPLIRISTDSTSTAIAGIEMFRNSINRSRIIQDGFGVNTRFIQYGVPSVPNPLYGAFQWQTSPVTSGTLVTQMTLLGGGNLGVGGVTAPTASIHTGASTTARASICLPHGTAPTTPVNGDMWTTTSQLNARINGVTYDLLAAPAWGGITGTLSAQADLQAALDAKLGTGAEAATVTTINGRIAAGSNVTITGSGTAASPYSISAAGGGGGGVSMTAATITLPAGRGVFEHTETITDASIASTDKINISQASYVDSDENDTEMLNIASLSARANTGSITVFASFPTRESGIIKLNYFKG